jgi:hypothetical protein
MKFIHAVNGQALGGVEGILQELRKRSGNPPSQSIAELAALLP